MAGPESKIERKVCSVLLLKHGIPNVKLGFDGWPDRMYLLPKGKAVFIEFKSLSGRLMPRQAYRIKCLTKWGYPAIACDDVDEAVAFVLGHLK
jgi:hypothetical protein